MASERPPTIDPRAAQRWQSRTTGPAAWLHEEVAQRMQQRLDWIKFSPSIWLDWDPARGGPLAHAALRRRYAGARTFDAQPGPDPAQVRIHRSLRWWEPMRWLGRRSVDDAPPPAGVEMLWANMALHMAADPQALIAAWHRLLAVDGFLMFSCLGPDTLRELRALYQRQGWPAPAHEFTDMHDWGDMLVAAGFAEPVMDMERIELSFETPARLLQELRELGRNLHSERFAGLRGRGWLDQLHELMARDLVKESADGRLCLSFEVVYGHAFKPMPRIKVASQTLVPLDQMRRALRAPYPGHDAD